MSEPTVYSGDLERDLRAYFAVTTTVELPRGVREMSARTFADRRRPVTAMLAGAGGVLATAALVFVLATHAIPHGGGSSSSTSLRNTVNGAAVSTPQALSTISYPGVNTTLLAGSGARLLLPLGHGTAAVSAAQAQATAVAAVGANAQTPGPAVLAFAQLIGRPQTVSCLCWVVDVPVRGGVLTKPGFRSQTELVLVDAVTGRFAAALTANGIP